MKEKLLLFGIVFFLTINFICVVCLSENLCPDSEVLDLQNDADQWKKQFNIFNVIYQEWWFFTVYDVESNIAMVFSYGDRDPQKLFDHQEASVAYMLWTEAFTNVSAGPFSVVDKYPFKDFIGSKQNATLSVTSSNQLIVLDNTTYHAFGSSQDGQLSWDFTYTQMAYPMRELFQIPVLMELDWISYMPSASVNGSIRYGNQIFTLNNAVGYHDHNYGSWPDLAFPWKWAQYNNQSQDFAFVMGSYEIPDTSDFIGYIFFRFEGQRYKLGTLCAESFVFTPLEFQQQSGYNYSVHNKLQTFDRDWKIDVDYTAHSSSLNPGGKGLDLIVFEQLSFYQVELSQKQKGEWVSVASMSGYGFSEWSDVKFNI